MGEVPFKRVFSSVAVCVKKTTSKNQIDLNNEDDLKNKEDLHIAGRHTALDIFRFAIFFPPGFLFSPFFLFFLHRDLFSKNLINLINIT